MKLMIKESKIEQARRELIQQALDEIYNVPDYSNLYTNAFCVIAKFGLQLKAREEKLFEGGDWDDPQDQDELLKKIEEFLNRNIR
ncbi:MAG: hypothetical protein ACFFG0_55645 [Candidatus Thorarchaeota archaeon]